VQTYLIYKLQSPSGKIYIGKTKNINKRLRKHERSSTKRISRLYSAIKKYDLKSFKVQIIEDNILEENINNREIYWISFYDSTNPLIGYNMTPGGDGGNIWRFLSEERKKEVGKKISEKNTGQKRSLEVRNNFKIIAKKRENDKTEGQKKIIYEKVSQTNKRKGITWPIRHCGNPGYKHTTRSKRKISQSKLGKSYEDLFDLDTVKRLKEGLRLRFEGKNNPNFIDFTIDDKIRLINELKNKKLLLTECCKLLNLSPYKIRKFFKSIGILDYQKFKSQSDEEWLKFFSKIESLK
jgi:group I intron endonuclease